MNTAEKHMATPQACEIHRECNLEDLMARYQRADRDAAPELVAALSPKLLLFFARPEATRNYAEDMLQECWLRIHKARHSYRPGSPVLPWLFAIARHTRVDGWRRMHRFGRFRQISLEDLPKEPAAPAVGGTSALEVERLLAELPENQYEVIYMMKVLDMSIEEIARTTGSTTGAVKQKAHRGYERLRRLLTT